MKKRNYMKPEIKAIELGSEYLQTGSKSQSDVVFHKDGYIDDSEFL